MRHMYPFVLIATWFLLRFVLVGFFPFHVHFFLAVMAHCAYFHEYHALFVIICT